MDVNMKKVPQYLIFLFLVAMGSSNAAAEHPLNTLKVGNWYEIPDTKMESVNPCPEVSCPPGNIKSVMKTWSGGGYDSDHHQLIVWGGGHGDYAGNEL